MIVRTPQRASRSAVLGMLATVASGRNLRDWHATVSWLGEKGFELGVHGLRDAAKDRLGRRSDLSGDPMEEGWIRDALAFDATKLDLELAVVIFPEPEHSDSLIEALRSTQRAVRIYRGYDLGLVAVIVFEGAREHRRLRTRLEELEPDLRWISVREVDDSCAEGTWLSLGEKVAGEEGLLR
jgi:hypothetical protein